jgi:hypothetical protein
MPIHVHAKEAIPGRRDARRVSRKQRLAARTHTLQRTAPNDDRHLITLERQSSECSKVSKTRTV